MTAEANAAIEGAFVAGAETVTVNDSHGTMDNLLPNELDNRARLILGRPKLDCMCEGLSSDFDVALFVGYHAPAGGPGVLAHTYSADFNGVRLNGHPVSEAEINALQAAAAGVPVGLVTGDDVICDIALRQVAGVRTVPVKTALGFTVANSLAPGAACEEILKAAREVVSQPGVGVTQMPERLDVEIDLPNVTAAELAALIPTIERTGDLTVSGSFTTPREVVSFITVAGHFAREGLRARLPLINRV